MCFLAGNTFLFTPYCGGIPEHLQFPPEFTVCIALTFTVVFLIAIYSCVVGCHLQKAVKDAQTEVNAQKDRLKSCNKDISDKINETNSLRKDIGASEVKVQELKHKISSLKENSQAAGAQVTLYIILYLFLLTNTPL